MNMLKLTDKVVYELQVEQGIFVITLHTEDSCKQHKGRKAYNVDFKLSKKSEFTFHFFNSWLQEGESIEEFLVRMNRLILNTNHFDRLIESAIALEGRTTLKKAV